jgi:antitoxin CptB
MDETRDIRRKRLVHRSRYRGVKESDLLFGQFAAQWLPILAWVYGRQPVPEQHDNDVFRMLRSFEPTV